MFRKLEGHYGLEASSRAKAEAIEALILSSVIGLLASRRLFEVVQRLLVWDQCRVRYRARTVVAGDGGHQLAEGGGVSDEGIETARPTT